MWVISAQSPGTRAHRAAEPAAAEQAVERGGTVDQCAEVACHELDAVLAGDRDLARDRMLAHLRSAFGNTEEFRARSPELFASTGSVPVRRGVAIWE